MKKLIVISGFLLALIFGFSNLSTAMKFAPITPGPNSDFIHYRVLVYAPSENAITCSRIVVMTDGAGNWVTAPQGYKQGLTTYDFYEFGNVRGTRVAELTTDTRIEAACSIRPVADYRRGTFLEGQQYYFLLNPQSPMPNFKPPITSPNYIK